MSIKITNKLIWKLSFSLVRYLSMDSTQAMAAQLNDHTYEDYNPTLEWVRDAGFDTLLVYVPGFKTQQLKAQVTSTRKLRILGERSHGDNKWSRFHKELPIPLYYDANQISAKFEGGILKIKHPKKMISPANPVQENKANISTVSAEPQKPTNEKPEEKKCGQDQFDQEVPPKTKIDEPTRGKVKGVANGSATEANIHVPPKGSEDQKSDHGLVEAEKNTSASDQKLENEEHFVQNAAKMHQEEETAVVSGSDEFKHHEAMGAQLNDHAYEDYNPTLEWVRDAGFDTLLVYIPGFEKQQLKVQVTSNRKLRILGERSHGDNRWSRFHKELPIPLYHDVNQINAKFEGGILQIKYPKKIIGPTNPMQENNANISAVSAEPQKPTNEKLQEKKSGQDQFDQEFPPKTKIEESTSEKVNGVANGSATEANIHVPPKGSVDQKSNHGLVEAEKNTSASDQESENEGHFVQNVAKMHREEETAVFSDSDKFKLAHHKQVLGGLVAEMKKPRKSTHLVLAAAFLVLVLGIYVQNAIRSNGESEK